MSESTEEVVVPLCPHCGAELGEVKIIMWGAIGGVLCPHCRTLLHCQMFAALVPAEDAAVPPPASEPSIGGKKPS